MPANRKSIATIAAYSKWAKTVDRQAATSAARVAFMGRFIREALAECERQGVTPTDQQVAAMADSLYNAHLARMRHRRWEGRRKADRQPEA